jgi:protein-tyrosine kinase
MSRTQDAWRKVEPQRSTPKGNRSELEPTEVVTSTEPMIFALSSEGNAETSSRAPETVIPSFRLTQWEPNSKSMLFFGPEEDAGGKEEFRSLRSRLHQLREKSSIKTILVTSSLPKEGRSFVAANLAQAMAQQGHRTLLIDADLRSPSLHVALGTSRTPGLSEYFLGEAVENSIVQQGQMENLFFIPAGRQISGQSEIVSSGVLKLLFERLAELFDWILVDSPAALPVSDAVSLSNHCDGVLIVLRSQSTPFDIVRKARKSFPEERLLGVVLNGIPADSHAHEAYYRVSTSDSKPNGKWL